MTATVMTIRVMVTDAWDTVRLDVTPEQTMHEVKTMALGRALTRADIDAYEVKFRGALVLDESRRLTDLGVPAGGALIVLPARRRPVR